MSPDFQKMNQFPNNSSGIESSLFENFQKDDFLLFYNILK
ncbi:hypothetical protein LEP1GSC038_1138 [Leptospira weilii str. 2006001855]|uniref:Uncharacterized protein n=1 Tax=Leptospira weilii str. 2006001855 TaxID=996804 RepID=M6FHQ0_9LEPT|nr:hypothetical protein LEP1GSC038_1138 [Leptospira weilii str. 2006001855]